MPDTTHDKKPIMMQRRKMSVPLHTSPTSYLQVNFLLFEAASGYSLFEIKDVDNIGLSGDTVQSSISDLSRFSKIASLIAFKPFTTAVDALEQINAVTESEVTEMLAAFLASSLPKVKEGKKAKYSLGVIEPKLASSIQEATRAMPTLLHFRHYQDIACQGHACVAMQPGMAVPHCCNSLVASRFDPSFVEKISQNSGNLV
jgi:hypothetical protein